MADKISAGLLMYNLNEGQLRIFLVHPGGPFFVKKNEGYWGIPKGLAERKEDLLETAKREFEEETGIKPEGNFIPLGNVVQKGGKIVHAWGFESISSLPAEIKCNTFEMEWPPKSGKKQSFPEVDKGEYFEVTRAKEIINDAQRDFINRLEEYLSLTNTNTSNKRE